MTNANLRRADLSEAYLKQANCSGSDFRFADLSSASLYKANLSGATLRYAYLTHSRNQYVDLSDGTLSSVKARHASFYRANMKDTVIENANLSSAILKEADLSNTVLRDTDLSDADCTNVELTDGDLQNTTLENTTFNRANLANTALRDANLTNATLRNADLPGVDLRDSKLEQTNLKDANMREINLENTHLKEANLSEAKLIAADCEGAVFHDANLIRASLENADLVRADLSGAYLFGTSFDGGKIDGETKICRDGNIGDLSTSNHCRYDIDAIPEMAVESLIEHDDEIEAAAEAAEVIRARRARSTYRRLEDLARQNGYPDLKSEMFIRRQDARRELLYAEGRSLKASFAEVQKRLFNYGESFARILSISIGTVVCGWLMYLSLGIVEDSAGDPIYLQHAIQTPSLIYDTLLHSILVFFSGNRVLETTGRVGEGVVVTQSMIGPILLAMLIFVLGRRAAR